MKFSLIHNQKAFDQAKPVIENITLIKNTISEEIKSFEKYLQIKSIPDDICLQITDPRSYEFCDDEVTHEEFLIWKAEKKRIYYQCKHHEYWMHPEYGIPRCTGIVRDPIFERPLIETSFQIRKRIYESHLSKFILEIAKKYTVNIRDSKKEDFEPPPDFEDIPF